MLKYFGFVFILIFFCIVGCLESETISKRSSFAGSVEDKNYDGTGKLPGDDDPDSPDNPDNPDNPEDPSPTPEEALQLFLDRHSSGSDKLLIARIQFMGEFDYETVTFNLHLPQFTMPKILYDASFPVSISLYGSDGATCSIVSDDGPVVLSESQCAHQISTRSAKFLTIEGGSKINLVLGEKKATFPVIFEKLKTKLERFLIIGELFDPIDDTRTHTIFKKFSRRLPEMPLRITLKPEDPRDSFRLVILAAHDAPDGLICKIKLPSGNTTFCKIDVKQTILEGIGLFVVEIEDPATNEKRFLSFWRDFARKDEDAVADYGDLSVTVDDELSPRNIEGLVKRVDVPETSKISMRFVKGSIKPLSCSVSKGFEGESCGLLLDGKPLNFKASIKSLRISFIYPDGTDKFFTFVVGLPPQPTIIDTIDELGLRIRFTEQGGTQSFSLVKEKEVVGDPGIRYIRYHQSLSPKLGIDYVGSAAIECTLENSAGKSISCNQSVLRRASDTDPRLPDSSYLPIPSEGLYTLRLRVASDNKEIVQKLYFVKEEYDRVYSVYFGLEGTRTFFDEFENSAEIQANTDLTVSLVDLSRASPGLSCSVEPSGQIQFLRDETNAVPITCEEALRAGGRAKIRTSREGRYKLIVKHPDIGMAIVRFRFQYQR